MHRHLRTASAVLGAAAVLGGASAGTAFAKDVTYHVTTEITGTWEHHWERDPKEQWARFEDYKLSFGVKAYYQDVTFRDGRLERVDLLPIQDATVDVTQAHMQYFYPDGIELYDCAQNEEISATGNARMERQPLLQGIETELLLFRPATYLSVLMDCGVEDEHRGVDLLQGGRNQQELGFGPMDLNWDMPLAAIGKDYVEHLVTPTAAQQKLENCPGYDEGYTVSCKLDWTAKIIMKKAEPEGGGGGNGGGGGGGNGQVIDVPANPAPTPKPTPAPPATPPTKSPGTVPQSTPTPTGHLSRDRRHVGFTVTCPAGGKPCAVTAGGKRYTVKPGARKKITITLKAKPKKGATVKVPVTVTPQGGKASKMTVKAKA